MSDQPMDPLSKVTEKKDLLGKIRGFVSGFSGYVERDQRREADKILRESIAQRYEEQWDRLSEVQRRLVSSGELEHVGEIERAAIRIRTFVDRVRGASYGYAGLFDHIRIGEDELARLYAYDLDLLQAHQRLSEAVGNVEAAVGTEKLPDEIRALQDLAQNSLNTLDQRDELLASS